MEPRIKNGFLRAIIFLPMWFVSLALVMTLASILVMFSSGVDMADEKAIEALFDVSFDSPVMLILTAFQVMGSFLALWLATKFIDRKPLMSIGLSVKDKANEMLVGLGFALAFSFLDDQFVLDSESRLVSSVFLWNLDNKLKLKVGT